MSKKICERAEKIFSNKRVRVALLCGAMLFFFTYGYVCGNAAERFSSTLAEENPATIEKMVEDWTENPAAAFQEALEEHFAK